MKDQSGYDDELARLEREERRNYVEGAFLVGLLLLTAAYFAWQVLRLVLE